MLGDRSGVPTMTAVPRVAIPAQPHLARRRRGNDRRGFLQRRFLIADPSTPGRPPDPVSPRQAEEARETRHKGITPRRGPRPRTKGAGVEIGND